jgi:dipeptidyl-peptidase-4
MKRTILAMLFAGFCFVGAAQTKLLTIEDALVNNRGSLAIKNLRQAQFIYGTDDVVYLDNEDGKDVWIQTGVGKGSGSVYLTIDELNKKLKVAGLQEVTSMPAIQFNQSADWMMTVSGNKIAFNPSTNKAKFIIDKNIAQKENVEESGAGHVAYVDKFNLYVSDGKTAKQLTKDGSENMVYASSVHRDEFGITKGTFWSNSRKSLAFYRMDQSMVTDYPIIDWSQRPAKAVTIKYPMAGEKSHHVTIGVYNTVTGKLVYLNTGEPKEQYLTNIAWSPDDKYVFIAVVNREQAHMKLNQYDATTGTFVKTLFEEKDEKYVEPLVPMQFVPDRPTEFLWQSNRDGWNHVYLYNTNGQLIKQLTKGSWEVTEVKGFDKKAENLFYVSTEESPLTRNLYRLNLRTGKTDRLTKESAVHTVQVSSSGNIVLDSYSDAAHPRVVQLIENATTKTEKIFEAKSPLADYALGEMTVATIKNAGGTNLYYRLFKPVNFDATKKYPVVVYWYGGPHNQMITLGFNGGAGDYWFQYMAERGYVVFTLDVRGSDNRGKAFEQAIFRKAGAPQMEDLLSGVEFLKSLPYVDASNMGLFGWSYGGFMTTSFMLNHPDVFKAGVAGGPVMDWKYYEVMYTERYMDTPQENPEGYAATDLTKQVDKLKGKLLLVHGLQDNVVVQQHSVNFVRAAIDKKVPVDYSIYPGHEHNVLGKDRAHLYQKVTDYFIQNLQGNVSF